MCDLCEQHSLSISFSLLLRRQEERKRPSLEHHEQNQQFICACVRMRAAWGVVTREGPISMIFSCVLQACTKPSSFYFA